MTFQGDDIRSLQSFWALEEVIGYNLALLQRTESFHLNRGMVNEDIGLLLPQDETIPFWVAKPLHYALLPILNLCHSQRLLSSAPDAFKSAPKLYADVVL